MHVAVWKRSSTGASSARPKLHRKRLTLRLFPQDSWVLCAATPPLLITCIGTLGACWNMASRALEPTLPRGNFCFISFIIRNLGDKTMQWETPSYNDVRFGFEVTMYINNR